MGLIIRFPTAAGWRRESTRRKTSSEFKHNLHKFPQCLSLICIRLREWGRYEVTLNFTIMSFHDCFHVMMHECHMWHELFLLQSIFSLYSTRWKKWAFSVLAPVRVVVMLEVKLMCAAKTMHALNEASAWLYATNKLRERTNLLSYSEQHMKR